MFKKLAAITETNQKINYLDKPIYPGSKKRGKLLSRSRCPWKKLLLNVPSLDCMEDISVEIFMFQACFFQTGNLKEHECYSKVIIQLYG